VANLFETLRWLQDELGKAWRIPKGGCEGGGGGRREVEGTVAGLGYLPLLTRFAPPKACASARPRPSAARLIWSWRVFRSLQRGASASVLEPEMENGLEQGHGCRPLASAADLGWWQPSAGRWGGWAGKPTCMGCLKWPLASRVAESTAGGNGDRPPLSEGPAPPQLPARGPARSFSLMPSRAHVNLAAAAGFAQTSQKPICHQNGPAARSPLLP